MREDAGKGGLAHRDCPPGQTPGKTSLLPSCLPTHSPQAFFPSTRAECCTPYGLRRIWCSSSPLEGLPQPSPRPAALGLQDETQSQEDPLTQAPLGKAGKGVSEINREAQGGLNLHLCGAGEGPPWCVRGAPRPQDLSS